MTEGTSTETITLNGRPFALQGARTVADLLERLQLASKFVAVERNRELVPRSKHAETPLEPGDELEVVTLTGGG